MMPEKPACIAYRIDLALSTVWMEMALPGALGDDDVEAFPIEIVEKFAVSFAMVAGAGNGVSGRKGGQFIRRQCLCGLSWWAPARGLRAISCGWPGLSERHYVTKPFAFEELLARIEVLLRRISPAAPTPKVLRFADITIDLSQRVARRAGRDLGLTATEFGLLRYLVENAGRVVSRMEILNVVWGYDFDPNTNIVEVYIAYLRRKVDRDFDTRLIQNVRGFGYQLSADAPQRKSRV